MGRHWKCVGRLQSLFLSWAVSRVQDLPCGPTEAWPWRSHDSVCHRAGGWGLGGWAGESATNNHCPATPPRMFHLNNSEQNPRPLIHFYTYQSEEGESIAGRKVRKEDTLGLKGEARCPGYLPMSLWPHRPRQHIRRQGSQATPVWDCCTPGPSQPAQ